MTTYRVFNTPFETALRVAMLLSVVPEDLDATSIQAIMEKHSRFRTITQTGTIDSCTASLLQEKGLSIED